MALNTFRLSRIDRREREYSAAAVLPNGSSASIGALTFAVLPTGRQPTDETTWETYPVSEGVATVTFSGVDAVDKSGSIEAPLGAADVFVKEVLGSLTTAKFVERIWQA